MYMPSPSGAITNKMEPSANPKTVDFKYILFISKPSSLFSLSNKHQYFRIVECKINSYITLLIIGAGVKRHVLFDLIVMSWLKPISFLVCRIDKEASDDSVE